MRTFRTLLAVGAVALLAACSSGTADPDETSVADQSAEVNGSDGATDDATTDDATGTLDLVGTWVLASGTTADGDLALDEAFPVTLEAMDDGSVAGQSACNRYMGSAEVNGQAIQFSQMASTMMACEEPVMALEQAYLAALAVVESGTSDGETLTLTGPDVELVFEAQGMAG